jgi:hypothetical protein
VSVVVKESGSLCISSNSHEKYPGKPREFYFFFANSTFHILVDDAYQVNLSTAIASG